MASRRQVPKRKAASRRKRIPGPSGESRSLRPNGRGGLVNATVDFDGLTHHLGYLVRRAQLWIFQDFIRRLAVVDIRPAQYSVLTVINANPGLSQMSLARALDIERARMTHLIDALEARRFVRRQPSRHDRRTHALYLTAEGRRALGRIRELAMRHEKRLAEKVGPANHKLLLKAFAVFARG